MSTNRRQAIQEALLPVYAGPGLWGEGDEGRPLPAGLERGSDPHLAYLTLVYTLSGGRDPAQLWAAARQSWAADPALFDPDILARARPADLVDRLRAYGLSRKPKSEATVWQRIGQALLMRAGGSVRRLLAGHDHDAGRLLAMLARSKTTFPVLSGPQTAPRWLYGLATAGDQPIRGAAGLPVPVSPAAARALYNLSLAGRTVPAELFGPLDALGRRGCAQHAPDQLRCPVAGACPVAHFCRYGGAA
ncbi:MAG: hypothetical protein L0322_19305 [Chloroflexi bacterium]|nr:hypothetical protein [Chloroflexota bacterium]MCI0643303.1 hypothetical protein [Chloroflexota bacterium]